MPSKISINDVISSFSFSLTPILLFVAISISAQCDNPLEPAHNFSIFVKNDVTFNGGHSEGPVAVGGDLVLNGIADAAGNDQGSYQVPGDGQKTGLFVKGKITTSGGSYFKALGSTYIKIGNSNGLTCTDNRIYRYGTKVAEKQASQTCTSVNTLGDLDIFNAFGDLKSTSTALGALPSNVSVTYPGNPDVVISLPSSGSDTYVFNTTSSFLNSSFRIDNLSSERSIVINITDASAITWNIGVTQSNQNAEAKYVLFNFPNLAESLDIQNVGGQINGSILAPFANVHKIWSGNIEGQVVANTYIHDSGEVHHAQFEGCFESSTCTPPTVEITGDTIICQGVSTTLTASGGGTYEWSHGLGSNSSITVSPTDDKTYTVTVSNEGCSTEASVTVWANGEAEWQSVGLNAECSTLVVDANYGKTGDFNVIYTIGGSTYTEGPFSTGAGFEIEGQGPGEYTNITIQKLGTDCTDVWPNSYTVCDDACIPPVVEISGDTIICLGESTVLTASGGGTYEWSHGLGTSASITVSPTDDKTYTVTVSNEGCSTEKSITVWASGEAEWQSVGLNAECTTLEVDANYGKTGDFIVIYTVGGSTYTEGPFSTGDGFEIDGQGPGEYTNITIQKIGTDCTDVWANSYTVCGDPCIPPSISQCESQINGSWAVLGDCMVTVQEGSSLSLSVNPNSFPAGYTEIWSGPNGYSASGNNAFISDNVTSSNEGNYTITVSNGECTISESIYVIVPGTSDCSCLSDNIVTNGSFTNSFDGWSGSGHEDSGIVSCGDGIKKAFIANNSGSEAVLYQDITSLISGGSNFTYSFMAGTHDPNGTHRARVKFYNSNNNLLSTPLDFEINKDVDPGEWCLNLQSYGPFEFTAPAGAYKVRIEFVEVTSNAAYIKVGNIDLKVCNEAPIITATPIDPKCFGETGGVTFLSSGGTGNRTVKLNGETVTSPINGLVAGSYTFIVTDETSCSSSVSVTIESAPEELELTIAKEDVSCLENNTGSVDLSVSGGTPDFEYSWSNGATTQDLASLGSGTFIVTVTDANLCTKSTSVSINEADEYSIGDYTWVDANGNGLQDIDETGLNGIEVNLYNAADDELEQSTVTADSNGLSGAYGFVVCEGDYYIIFGANPEINGIQYSLTDNNTGIEISDNSDANKISGQTVDFTINATNPHPDYIDAGYVAPASIGDYVWVDANGNGLQDNNESGLDGIGVSLTTNTGGEVTDLDGNVVGTETTSNGGAYLFDNLPAGSYKVTFEESATLSGVDYLLTDVNTDGSDTEGGDTNTDSDAGVMGMSQVVVLAVGEAEEDIDAGYVAPASIGDYVWVDANGNGLQDNNESGLDGIGVSLTTNTGGEVTDLDGNVVGTETTSNGGAYLFDNLPAGSYKVTFEESATISGVDYLLTDVNADGSDTEGGDTNTDSDAGAMGMSQIVELGLGEDEEDIDAGYLVPASIGNFVWFDLNGDGIQDNNEAGINGVVVKLSDGSGNPVFDLNGNEATELITSNGGYYSFDTLKPGDYIVEFEVSPTVQSLILKLTEKIADDPGGRVVDPDEDSDASPSTGFSQMVTLQPGDDNITIDAGYIADASIGDFVWADLNANGIQDEGEPGMFGIPVVLWDLINDVSDTVYTNANGYYLFDELDPGDYYVEFVDVPGYTKTLTNIGNDALDSDASQIDGTSDDIFLLAGVQDTTIDAGYIPSDLIICGNVYYDLNQLKDNTVNGFRYIPSGINALLVRINQDNSEEVVAKQSIPVSNEINAGIFEFVGQAFNKYYVMLSTSNPNIGNAPPSNSSLPPTYINTGEFIGVGPGHDGTINGTSSIFETTTLNVKEVNFGIIRFTNITID